MNVVALSSEQSERERHKQEWEKLARDIALADFHNQPAVNAGDKADVLTGELTILGSGIEALSFNRQDENYIKSADYVFYCVADPATAVWIRSIRPDAFDLYVLYDDSKPRYSTYMQMTEAMLHHVRCGKRVTGIYYGHPGVFVLSTHRAIDIARREGHKANMRPGISALDTLCADLGVDPSYPGMQTFEATDMLIRNREPDTSTHLVLWQVGLIGELGYRRLGYVNNSFSTLIEYLQSYYGEDYPVTNYIGSRYPGVAPTIETYRLNELHDPAIQRKVTGISTFYIAPKTVRGVDREVAEALGIIKAGEKPVTPQSPLRQIANYHSRERRALDAFASFKVPSGYHWQEKTEAAQFVLSLLQDPELRQLYEDNPLRALRQPEFSGLTEREVNFLASKDQGAVQIAAKGLHERNDNNDAFLQDLYCSSTLAKRIGQASSAGEIDSLVKEYRLDTNRMTRDVGRFGFINLYPWSGVYYDAASNTCICLMTSNANTKKVVLEVNGEAIKKPRYYRGTLEWSTKAGNSHTGSLRFDLGTNGLVQAIGSIWDDQEEIPARGNVSARSVSPFPKKLKQTLAQAFDCNDLKHIWGSYCLRKSKDTKRSLLQLKLDAGSLTIDGVPAQLMSYENGRLFYQDPKAPEQIGQLNFLFDPLAATTVCFGDGIVGMKQLAPGEIPASQPVETFINGEMAQKALSNVARAGREAGGILFYHSWQKYWLSNIAAARFLQLI